MTPAFDNIMCAVDLVIVGGPQHSPLGSFIIGSTTQFLIRHAPCAGLTLVESGAYVVIGVLMAFFLFQSVFLIRFPLVSLAVESVGLGWAVRVIVKNKKVLSEFRQSLRENLRRRPFAFWVFGADGTRLPRCSGGLKISLISTSSMPPAVFAWPSCSPPGD